MSRIARTVACDVYDASRRQHGVALAQFFTVDDACRQLLEGNHVAHRNDNAKTGKGHSDVKQGMSGEALAKGQLAGGTEKTKNAGKEKKMYGSTGSKSSGGTGSSQGSGGGSGGSRG